MSIRLLQEKKLQQAPITMVTCYDAWSAKLLSRESLDCLLVGDSVAMVMHGFDSTIHADVEMMVRHTQAVARQANPAQLLVADMPFMSFRKGKIAASNAATALMQAGAGAVKIEGVQGHLDCIQHLVESGIPVMGHLGLTPQSIHQLGGHRLQAKSEQEAADLLEEALALEKAGCFAMVLECVPEALGQAVASALQIPVIGIGAGRYVDGQVLVLHDLLGFSGDFKPKFLRHFSNGASMFSEGIQAFVKSVSSGAYPNEAEVYRPIPVVEEASPCK